MLTLDQARRIAAEPCEFGTPTLEAALDCLRHHGSPLGDTGARMLLLRELTCRCRQPEGRV